MISVLHSPIFRAGTATLLGHSKIICKVVLFCLLTGLAPSLFGQIKDPVSHPKFVNPLPNPDIIDATGGGSFTMRMAPATQWLGLVDVNDNPLHTSVWGYALGNNTPTYPGPTFVAKKNEPIDVRWENHLPNTHLLPIDYSLHIAHPTTWIGQGIPAVTHLHGGHTEAASDGHPDAWYTSNFQFKGHDFVKETYHYENDQEAATLWYHDHALGITRLNVYAGLAGFYLLRDDNELGLGLPSGAYERGIVFQDRNFDNAGQFKRYDQGGESEGDCQDASGGAPLDMDEPILAHPEFTPIPPNSTNAEFFGDYILVNAMAWPQMPVEPRQYRLRLLNGADSRFFALEFKDGNGNIIPFLQIGTDNGLLPSPVQINSLVMGPGERADVLVNFALATNPNVTLFNYGPDAPFKGNNFNFDGSRPTGQLMQFKVILPLNPGIPPTNFTQASDLRPAIVPMSGIKTRKLVLFEGRDQYCRLRPQLGILDENSPVNGSLMWDECTTENPQVNDIEYWDIYNATEDAHPMHLHLVSFQILGRAPFEGDVTFVETGDPISGGTKQILTLDGPPPVFPGGWNAPANEKGWKDTGIVPPGEVMRVVAKFDRAGKYVWHCHILSHEDHEMMRNFIVGPVPAPVFNECPQSVPNLTGNSSCQAELPDYAADLEGRELCDIIQSPAAGTLVNPGNVAVKLTGYNVQGASTDCVIHVKISGGCGSSGGN
ncbi:MAG: multicopper oxidase domain-containing protein [Lewinellaceae bacterium]|nr:multicopper oxidase domain-containing protein [Saprospiraceae bacterium]MCB9315966.1 multicopper oxidase domain-containing protein [Lewinellaceae bacterium]MCB9330105.1 multicopper oxidase domain-containing protein [Lewinellaceae bacterium]